MEYLFIVLAIIAVTAFYEIRLRKIKKTFYDDKENLHNYYESIAEDNEGYIKLIEDLNKNIKRLNDNAKKEIYKKESSIHNQPNTKKV